MIHEVFHVLEFVDDDFKRFMDDFLNYQTLPTDQIVKLLERVTDRAAAMYLVPKKELRKQYSVCPDPRYLSDYFQVSYQSIIYRLKNTGILVPT
jgi:Zn-dependent peptidase ImmA (M78 family)